MQIFKCEYDLPKGKINHIVHDNWDDKGNLHFTEHDLREEVKVVCGNYEYEYFLMIHQKDMEKFPLYCLWKSFTLEQRMTVGDLRKMYDDQNTKTKQISGLKTCCYFFKATRFLISGKFSQ